MKMLFLNTWFGHLSAKQNLDSIHEERLKTLA